jgi:hypothetical protein
MREMGCDIDMGYVRYGLCVCEALVFPFLL